MRYIILCAGLLFIGLGTLRAHPLEIAPQDGVRVEYVKKVIDTYTSQIGVREATGHNDGVQVEAYLKTTGFTKGAPWCAAFLSWTFIQANVQTIHAAWAPAWFPPAKTIYTRGLPMKIKPERADVFGLYFNNMIAHVGFIDDWPPSDDYAITVEGNTNLAGSAEGDGVYRKRRLKQNIYKVSRWI